MRVEVHVKAIDQVAEAKGQAEPLLAETDELVIIVDAPRAPIFQDRKAAS